MTMLRLTTRLSTLFIMLAACAALAFGQANQTWVGGSGNDANAVTNCQRSAPCATFAIALTKTNAGGEINVADPGQFGPMTIDKSITIDGGGVFAGVQASGGTNGVTINAPASGVVVLRGLTLNGLLNTGNAGQHGVKFNSGSSLYVENCVIENFAGIAVSFDPPGQSLAFLFVKDTIIRNNQSGGILISGIKKRGTIEKTRMEGTNYGLRSVAPAGTLTETYIFVRDSLASGNGAAGFLIEGGEVNMENNTATNNVYGIRINLGALFLSNFTGVSNFTSDVFVDANGNFASYGNNRYRGGSNPQITFQPR